jgi:hypothetical protein
MAQLRPGGMGLASEPQNARPGDFANSMADAMDTAFHNLLSSEIPTMKTFEVNTNSREARDRRRLFVAIAQGIVRHFKDNAGALVIKNSLNNPTNEHIDIQVDSTLI